MSTIESIIQRVAAGDPPGRDDLVSLLSLAGAGDRERLHRGAYAVKARNVGRTVRIRGLIEFSNICTRDCYYCGIRKSNRKVERYAMTREEILQRVAWAYTRGYTSLVLQSGERSDSGFTSFVRDIVGDIKDLAGGALGITLSAGEQSEAVYGRWFEAGAHRYLLRIETVNRGLYRDLHPADNDWGRRRGCLDALRRTGYQVGTGVMIGLPGQTIEDLADDILFFREQDVDMIGMGPYLVQADTPLGRQAGPIDRDRQLALVLNMIAVTRLVLPDINIAATTALHALDPRGREQGMTAGANVVMINITDARYRGAYQLYEGKPGVTTDADEARAVLEEGVAAIGETITWNEWGDAPRFDHRRANLPAAERG